MTVLDELPFSHVEKEGFRQFCHDMQPKFHVISRTTLTKDCIKLFYVEKCKLKDYLKEFSKRVSLTTDMWTSVQNLGYMVITAHFVDKDWILRKKIISFKVVPHPHKGEVLAKAVETSLLEWGLENVMTITLDNAKNNDTCVSDLVRRLNRRNALLLEGEFIQVRCFAHVINLVVRNGVDEAKPTIKRLRRSVKYVRSSPSRLQAFKKSISEENLTSKRAVCLDVKTRWNSTYLMIDSALEFKEAFENLELNDPSYKHECTVKGELLDEGDWGILKALHTFLEEFYLLTKRVSGSKYCTSNMYFDELIQVKDLILHNLGSDDLFIREMAEKMNEELNKYCKIDSLNLILVVALVLDPRYKLQYVEYWYSNLFGKTTDHNEEVRSEQVEGFVRKLKDLMKKLFNHYKAENLSMYNGDDPQNEANTTNSVGMAVKRPSSKELFKGTLKRKSHGEMLSDLNMYLSDEVLEADEHHFDILAWWKEKVPAYHALAIMARDILAIPVRSVASECVFSTAGRVLDSFRSSLTPMIVEFLITTQDWLRSPMPIISVEERLETLEEIEEAVLAEMNALDIASTS